MKMERDTKTVITFPWIDIGLGDDPKGDTFIAFRFRDAAGNELDAAVPASEEKFSHMLQSLQLALTEFRKHQVERN